MLSDTMDKTLAPGVRDLLTFRLVGLTAGLAAATFALMGSSVWVIKREALQRYNARASQVTQKLQTETQDFVDRHIRGLDDVAALYAAGTPVTKDRYKEVASDVLKRNPGYSSVNYVNRDFIVEEIFPYGPNRTALNLDIKSRFDVLPVAHRAITHRKPATTDLIDLVQGGQGLLILSPVFQGDRWAGLVEGVFKVGDFTQTLLEKPVGKSYHYTVLDETSGREIFTSLLPTAYQRSTPYDTYFTLRLGDRTLWVILHPKSPPFILLPLIVVLALELCLGGLGFYLLWRSPGTEPA
jgi:sensor domain CHASE-containing protein